MRDSNTQHQQPLFSASGESAGFDIKDFLFTYVLRYWYLYVLFIAGGFGLAWLKLRYETPMYKMRGTLLIRTEESSDRGISSEAIIQDLGIMDGGPNYHNEIEILKSRTLMTETIKKLGIEVSYYTVGRVRTSESYPAWPVKLAAYSLKDSLSALKLTLNIRDTLHFTLEGPNYKSTHQFGQQVSTHFGQFVFLLNGPIDDLPHEILIEPAHELGKAYSGGLTVRGVNTYADVVELVLNHPVPQKGIDILNTLVEVYNEATIEDKNKVGRNTIAFIDDRIQFLTRELSEVEGNLEQYKKANRIPTEIAGAAQQLVSEMSAAEKDLSALEIQQTILAALEAYLKNALTRFEPAPVNLVPNQLQLATLIGQYNQLVLERQRLLRTATPENPVVQNLSTQVEVQRQSILETIANANRETALSLNELRAKNQFYQGRISAIPSQERGLIDIKRQQGIKEALFLYLLQKREETALSLAVAVPNSRIIDPAIQTGGPISPNRRSTFLTYLLVGALLASAIIYLKYLLVNTVQSESDIAAKTRAPILAAIAQGGNAGPIVVRKGSRSAMAEMFRLLRTNLQFLAAGKRQQVILVTSGTSGEGKSFATLNLAITLALGDKKTVILELDLRKPKVVKYLTQSPGRQGITNYLIGQQPKEGLVQTSDIHPNLYYVSAGPIPPNPAELLMTRELAQLIEELRQEFDYILLDTPPVGMVADAFLLGPLADASLYIVRHGYSLKSTLGLLDEIHREQKLPQLAIVFNGLKTDRWAAYGYGSKYGYGYGYGYGKSYGYGYYEDDEKPKSRFPWLKRRKKR